MAENSAIEWCDHTFNPWIGCTKVGPGCDNCYAADLSRARLGVPWGPGERRRHTAASTWKQPRAWDRRAARLGIRYRVFCASLADVFDNEVPEGWRVELFQLIRQTPNLDWLLVTKRIGNADRMAQGAGEWPANVWLGATIVNQVEADRDIPKLLAVEGPRFRFLSMEPLLGPVDLTNLDLGYSVRLNALTGESHDELGRRGAYHTLHWIIVGGESGPSARPMHPDWARSLRDQCAAAGVPFLFKQWGEWAPMDAAGIGKDRPIADRHGNVRDSMLRYVTAADGMWGRRVRGHSFTDHATDLVYLVGKKAAGRLLDGVQHDGVPS